jgi:hypothetical protein
MSSSSSIKSTSKSLRQPFAPTSSSSSSDIAQALPSSKALDAKVVTASDIMALVAYSEARPSLQRLRLALKKKRRVDIGPNASVTFQNYDLVWLQIHEMLFIEKGGEKQVPEEISAYSPLIPQGSELVLVAMFGWSNAETRDMRLSELGHVENTFQLVFDRFRVNAVARNDDGIERTLPSGKTSAVHFLVFKFTPEEVRRK